MIGCVQSRTDLIDSANAAYDDIEVPRYSHYKEVIVDVITLDSTSCAP